MRIESISVPGFLAGGVATGIKRGDKPDMALVVSIKPATGAAVFTKNLFAAPPVLLGRKLFDSSVRERIGGILINSGCANACTGDVGLRNAQEMSELPERLLREEYPDIAGSVFIPMSTGVIGAQLPMERIRAGAKQVYKTISATGWHAAAEAIMTTDTCSKIVFAQFEIPSGSRNCTASIIGIAKGSGMIHPDMATMLGVIVTDLKIDQRMLHSALVSSVNRSFNCISVDGDTSTNDTVVLLANGALENEIIVDPADPAFSCFCRQLEQLSRKLAQAIVRDGEGATKFVTVLVSGAESEADAKKIARTVATSPLVKTAIFGGDANWGRVLAAAGRAGAEFSTLDSSLFIQGGTTDNPCSSPLKLVSQGEPLAYSEEEAQKIFRSSELILSLRIGTGDHQVEFWTTDLSYEYVRINGDYRS